MIIIDQKKEAVLNFDNVAEITAKQYYTNAAVEATLSSGHKVGIGTFANLEDAKEVIREITKTYSSLSSGGQYHGMVYTIPPENELCRNACRIGHEGN